MREVLRWPGREPVEKVDFKYSQALDESKMDCQPAPACWWEGYADIMHHMDLDAVPWQEAECQRLMAEHGPERFAGLNLFGVV